MNRGHEQKFHFAYFCFWSKYSPEAAAILNSLNLKSDQQKIVGEAEHLQLGLWLGGFKMRRSDWLILFLGASQSQSWSVTQNKVLKKPHRSW